MSSLTTTVLLLQAVGGLLCSALQQVEERALWVQSNIWFQVWICQFLASAAKDECVLECSREHAVPSRVS